MAIAPAATHRGFARRGTTAAAMVAQTFARPVIGVARTEQIFDRAVILRGAAIGVLNQQTDTGPGGNAFEDAGEDFDPDPARDAAWCNARYPGDDDRIAHRSASVNLGCPAARRRDTASARPCDSPKVVTQRVVQLYFLPSRLQSFRYIWRVVFSLINTEVRTGVNQLLFGQHLKTRRRRYQTPSQVNAVGYCSIRSPCCYRLHKSESRRR